MRRGSIDRAICEVRAERDRTSWSVSDASGLDSRSLEVRTHFANDASDNF